jgi:hypothetical protein
MFQLQMMSDAEADEICTRSREDLAQEASRRVEDDLRHIVRALQAVGVTVGANAITSIAAARYDGYFSAMRVASLDPAKLRDWQERKMAEQMKEIGVGMQSQPQAALMPEPKKSPAAVAHLRPVPLDPAFKGEGPLAQTTTVLDVGAHKMDAPAGPQCRCGQPSTHESGWCGKCAISEF